MSQLDQIVNITITQLTQAVTQVGFGIPLILGPTGFLNSDVIRYYSSASAMLSDGFDNADPEYIYALEAFEQALSPTLIGVGKRTPVVAQVDTITVNTATAAHNYTGAVGGLAWAYLAGGSPTLAQIATGIAAAINALVGAGASAVAVGPVVTNTATTPGTPFLDTTTDGLLTIAPVTPSNGVQNDINAILNATNGNNWYGLALCSNTDGDILQAAALIETLEKIFVAVTGDANVPTSSSGDIASVLKGKGYKRTALMYSSDQAAAGMDAAWLGGQLPQVPGSSTWKFKQLVGINPDTFTDNQRLILIGQPGSPGKNVNIYETVGGQAITEEGFMVGGQFIDITVGIDWLKSTMQTNVYGLLVQAPKIPYTNQGAAVVENAVRQTLLQGAANGLIDPTSIQVSVPDIPSGVSAADRAERLLPGVKFSCRLAGAFHFIQINGTVSV